MADQHTIRAVAARAGFTVEDFVDPAYRPAPLTVWKPFVRASTLPVLRISDHDADPAGRLDREWLRVSRANGTIADDGTLLLSIEGAGRLPWLRVRAGAGRQAPHASRVGLPGQSIGFVALAPGGHVATSVSTEEWETWILTVTL